MTAPLSPKEVLRQVAAALPEACRQEVIIVGSLAAGYYFFSDDGEKSIRTKDVDCMFSPHARAVATATRVTEDLLKAQWVQRDGERWSVPGKPEDSPDRLPLVRLKRSNETEWSLELLSAPDNAPKDDMPMRQFHRVSTSIGDFAICSFGFLALAEYDPVVTQFGVRIARPEMMALANLLHHERIGPELISDTDLKRSNKDLGRVLALAFLANARNVRDGTELGEWADGMWSALEMKFKPQARQLAMRAGRGIKELLASPQDLDQALRICNVGLLASRDINAQGFSAIGRRFVAEVIEPLEARAQESD
jgi:hypothetical protein